MIVRDVVLGFAVALVAVACAPRELAATPVEREPAAPVIPAPPPVAPTSESPVSGSAASEIAASTPTTPIEVPAAPAKPLTPSKMWPFVAWDRAEAITFNHLAYGPGVQLRVYDGQAWSGAIVARQPISTQQGERAVQWVVATRGELEVSKCPFPRHAVVLYAGETPVGSVNVCFECGDILVWPDFEPPPAEGQEQRRNRLQMAGYKKVFPRWEKFFRDELGLPLAPSLSP
jgi:hypothetical protein